MQIIIGNSTKGVHMQPGRRFGDPAPHNFWRFRVLKLRNDTLWNQDKIEKSRQKLDLIDEDQIVERCRVGDNDHVDKWLPS